MANKRGRPPIPIDLHIQRGTYRRDRHGPKPPAHRPVIPQRCVEAGADLKTGAAWVAAIEATWQVGDPIGRAQLERLAAAHDRRCLIAALLDGPTGLLARLGAGEVGLSAKSVETLLKGEKQALDEIGRALDALDLEVDAAPARVAR